MWKMEAKISTKKYSWGFSEKEGEDYVETPVSRYTYVTTIIFRASIIFWKLHQVDVENSFLNGVFKQEEVHIELRQGFEVHERESHVYKVKKVFYRPQTQYFSLYGYQIS